MKLEAIAAFSDNYIWLLHDGHDALVVDPGDAAPVLLALEARKLRLAGILLTHHHADHVGGVDELRAHLHGPVYGPAFETLPQPCLPCEAGDVAELLGQRFSVINVPGHTSGHIAFFLEQPSCGGAPILFCGDTLFSGGCGRLFEGTAAQMHGSLQRLAALPGTTRVCCGHEYTLSNLRFAQVIEPANQALTDYVAWCEAQRRQLLPTLPSNIALERQVNPFLRCTEPAVIEAVTDELPAGLQPATAPDYSGDAVAVLAALRQWKNQF